MNKIKEYFCRNCNKVFQVMVKGEEVVCPICHSDDVIKVAYPPKNIELIKCDCSCKGGKNDGD
jgi:DNA-directed RNA polymerase subunit RPC12/RpoP